MVGKVVQHPSSENNPAMTVAEAMGLVDQMEDVCIVWTHKDGNMHIGWSKMTNADLASVAVVMTTIAAHRIMEE